MSVAKISKAWSYNALIKQLKTNWYYAGQIKQCKLWFCCKNNLKQLAFKNKTNLDGNLEKKLTV